MVHQATGHPIITGLGTLGKLLNLSDFGSSENGNSDAPPQGPQTRGEGAPVPASSRHQQCPANAPGVSLPRENVLVLDIFFEALNYETVEQKKAYEVSELLGVWCV